MLPILFQSHDFILYSYPLLMGIGWGVAYQTFFYLIPIEQKTVKLQVLFWGIFVSAWIGAKILFLITQPQHRELISTVSFWTGGGFVFYGGFLAAAFYCFLYHKIIAPIETTILWAMVPALTLGHGIGRIGCFLAGCCFGKKTNLFWGVFMHGHYRHPTQLIEAIGLITLGLYFLNSHKKKILYLPQYLISYGLLRLAVESLRGDDIRGLWGPLSPSEWISLLLILTGLFLIQRSVKSVA